MQWYIRQMEDLSFVSLFELFLKETAALCKVRSNNQLPIAER